MCDSVEMASSPSTRPSRSKRSLIVNLSPKFIQRNDAVQLKRSRRESIALRRVETRELPLREAEAFEEQEGKEFLVSPKGTNSNENFKDMKEIVEGLRDLNIDLAGLKQHMKVEKKAALYSRFVGASRQMCEYDLITFVLNILDFYIVKAFKEDENYFAPLLIPSVVEESNLRYLSLGAAIDHRKLSSLCVCAIQDLLFRAERLFLDSINLSHSFASSIRGECAEFFSFSVTREWRTFAAYIFSSALAIKNVDHSSSLPPLKPLTVDFTRPKSLKFMALRALVLRDLEMHLEGGELTEDCTTLYHCGVLLAKRVMAEYVPFSFRVSYGELIAEVLRDGESSADIDVVHSYELGDASQGGIALS